MSYYLTREEKCFHVSIFAWPQLLQTAQSYGWQPAGTKQASDESPTSAVEEAPANGENLDPYLANESQWVSDDDVDSLARALEAALADLDFSEYEFRQVLQRDRGVDRHGIEDRLKLRKSFSHLCDQDPEYLKSFINFTREGGFAIG